MNIFRRMILAASCVTALPLPKSDSATLFGLSKYLPTVGILIGGLLAAENLLLLKLHAPYLVHGIVLALSWLALTGAIHMDGLMDAADGIFSHRSPERMLEIMRDSRVGNFGALAGVSVLLIKIAVLSDAAPSFLTTALVLVPSWARWCEVYAIGKFPYARPEGMGKIWHDSTNYPRDLLIAAVVPILFSATAVLRGHLIAVGTVLASTLIVGMIAAGCLARKIQGHTGDTYGAVVECAEAGGLLLGCLAARMLAH